MSSSTDRMKTFWGVQPYGVGRKGEFIPAPARPATDEGHAKRMASRMAEKVSGAVAFSRRGDPDLGDWDPPVILERHGSLPDNVEELLAGA